MDKMSSAAILSKIDKIFFFTNQSERPARLSFLPEGSSARAMRTADSQAREQREQGIIEPHSIA